MKDYEALSKKHFDEQAAEYDRRDTYYYSRNGKIHATIPRGFLFCKNVKQKTCSAAHIQK